MAVVHELPVTTPTSIAFGKEGYIYVSSIMKPSSVVNSYKLESGKLVAVGEPIGSGFLQEPGDIIVDDDALYVSDFGKGQILKFSLPYDGKSPPQLFAVLENANGIRLGPDGNIYVTQTYATCGGLLFGKGYVNVFSKNGGKPLRKFHADAAFGLAFSKAGNKLLVSDWRSPHNGIMEYTPEGHYQDRWGGSSANSVFGICTDQDDNTYITTFFGHVVKYNSNHEEVATVNTLSALGLRGLHLSDVEVGPDGLVYVADGFKNAILVFDFKFPSTRSCQ